MRTAGRLAVVVVAALLALAMGYAATRAVVTSDAEPVPPIDLDNPTIVEEPAETTPPADGGATVVPPPTLAPGPAPTAADPPPPTAPADDDDPDADADSNGGDDD